MADAADIALSLIDRGKIGTSVSRNLYSSAKKESKEAIKKEVVKDTVSETGKQVLKKDAKKVIENSTEYTYSNGTYQKASYHGNKNNFVKNKAPNNGQKGLDNSIPIGDNTTRRIGISDNEIIVFDETEKGIFHGHVRSWDELTNKMKAVLKKSGLVNKKGRIKNDK